MISLGETWDQFLSVFRYTPNQVICHAYIEGTVSFTCKDVNIIIFHCWIIIRFLDYRVKPDNDKRYKWIPILLESIYHNLSFPT